jgi:hypothetical protein
MPRYSLRSSEGRFDGMAFVEDVRHADGGVERKVQGVDRLSGLVDNIAQMNFDRFHARKNDLGLLRRQRGKEAISRQTR